MVALFTGSSEIIIILTAAPNMQRPPGATRDRLKVIHQTELECTMNIRCMEYSREQFSEEHLDKK